MSEYFQNENLLNLVINPGNKSVFPSYVEYYVRMDIIRLRIVRLDSNKMTEAISLHAANPGFQPLPPVRMSFLKIIDFL